MPIPIPGGPVGTSHASGCYYANAITGSIQRECNPINAALLAGAGYFGKGNLPATPFNAFGTFQDAKNWVDEIRAAEGGIGRTVGPGIIPPGSTPGSSGSGGSSGGAQGSDWAHLMTRLAEFGIGAILVIIGFNAVVSRTKGYQRVETVVTGVAGKVPR
jgi:hypothetical protein